MLFPLLFLTTLTLAHIPPHHNHPRELPHYTQDVTSPNLTISQNTTFHDQPNFTFSELYALQKSFLDNFIAPADSFQAKRINSTILAPNVLGRIDVTRTFNGRELNTEYLFGLFANLAASGPSAFSLLGIPVSYEIIHFAANQNIVSSLTRFMFKFPLLDKTIPVEIESWNTYNAKGEISQYDASFKWWQWTIDFLLEEAMPILKANSRAQVIEKLTGGLAGSICGTAMKYCNGTNAQYASMEECNMFLSKKVRFGSAYELGRDTLLCRSVHQNMVPFRPSVHCPHIGKTGGGFCTDDTTYEETLKQDYFKNAPYIPYGY